MKKTILSAAISMVIGIGGAWFFLDKGESQPSAAVHSSERAKNRVAKKSATGRKTVKKVDQGTRISEVAIRAEHPVAKPAVADEDEEATLTTLQKAVLQSLRDAGDDDNLKAVRKAIAKFKTTVNVKNGEQIPKIMRSEAVSALKWFGAAAAEDLMDFTTDADEEVANDALDGVMEALDDSEMSDYERSAIVKAFLHQLTDADAVESLVDQLMDMRNSVKADTAIDILTNGTEPAKEQLMEELENHFDDEVTTVEDLEKWKLQNPDDPDDDDLYGGAQAQE